MSNEDKINSGKYIAISKIESNFKNILLAISILGLVGTLVQGWNLKFDSQKSKIHTVDHPDTYHVKEADMVKINNLLEYNIKMQALQTAEFKDFIKEQKEVNEAVGMDLKIIKSKIK